MVLAVSAVSILLILFVVIDAKDERRRIRKSVLLTKAVGEKATLSQLWLSPACSRAHTCSVFSRLPGQVSCFWRHIQHPSSLNWSPVSAKWTPFEGVLDIYAAVVCTGMFRRA